MDPLTALASSLNAAIKDELIEFGKALAERTKTLGLSCALDVTAACSVRLVVPGLPDPSANASAHLTLAPSPSGAVDVHVVGTDVQFHFIPEGK
jgi:hypothetical protein